VEQYGHAIGGYLNVRLDVVSTNFEGTGESRNRILVNHAAVSSDGKTTVCKHARLVGGVEEWHEVRLAR
jgi:hypothetical protein